MITDKHGDVVTNEFNNFSERVINKSFTVITDNHISQKFSCLYDMDTINNCNAVKHCNSVLTKKKFLKMKIKF